MKLILHIGQQKTGSTVLQNYLRKSQVSLQAEGFLYPQSLGIHKQNKLLSEFDSLTPDGTLYKTFKNEIQESSNVHTVICSEENLFSIPEFKIERIYNFLSRLFDSIQIVAYLRKQDDHFLSIYQQSVRGSETATIKEVLDKKINGPKYNYHAIISRWQKVFHNAEVTARAYGLLINNDIIDDFNFILGLKRYNEQIETDFAITNKSFDAESIELIRLFNLLESENKLILPHHRKRALRIFLKHKPRNKKFILADADRHKIWQLTLNNNQKLCDEFIKEGQKKYFLKAPHNITTKEHYNKDVDLDNLYSLFFDIFEA